MQAMSAEALRVPTGSHKPVVSVDAWSQGQLLASDIPVVSGSLQITAGQTIRSRLSLVVADNTGDLTPRPGSALSPWGAELHVKAGVMVGPSPELVSLGWFPIISSETFEEWRTYERWEEPGVPYRVSRGLSINVEAVDRAQVVQDARFENRETPTMSNCFQESAYLLRGLVPFRAPVGIYNSVVPSGITYDDDRLGALNKLANACDCDFVFDYNGVATYLPQDRRDNPPVWTLDQRSGGTLIAFNRALNRDMLYNAVIVRSTDEESQLTLQARVEVQDGPLRYGGPMGRIPYFSVLDVLKTQSALEKAANTQLARLTSRRSQTITVSCIANYALEVGDVISLEAPYGYVNGEITTLTYPLDPGPMTMTLAVNPVEFSSVS